MKKIYKKPEIEAVSYAADTSLCGSCESSTDDLMTLAEIASDLYGVDLGSNFFTSRIGSGYFQNYSDGCRAEINDLLPDFTDSFDYFCKFTAGLQLFIS